MAQNRNNRIASIFPGFILGLIAAIFLMGIFCPSGLCGQEKKAPQVTDYKIGTNDLLEIRVFELPELNQTVRVAEDGSVSLSLIGKVEVAGLTAQELEKKLSSLLDEKYTKASHVTVFIREYQKVAVSGAVGKPGNYELVGPATLLQLISLAGGVTPEALGEILVFRQGKDGQKTKITINLQDLVFKGDPSLNIDLQPSDVVYIPVDGLVTIYVYGQVKTPGAIQFKQSQRITLLRALAQAGGPTEWAKTSRVMITRPPKSPGREVKIRVNLDNIISGKISDILLGDGDVIIVP
jgi:polysaccharide export outer membrane protein